MTFTGGRRQLVESVELLSGEYYRIRRRVLLDSGDTASAGNGRDVITSSEEPRQRRLGRGRPDLGADGTDFIDDGEVPDEVLAGEPRVRLAPVVVGEVVDGANLAGEQPMSER